PGNYEVRLGTPYAKLREMAVAHGAGHLEQLGGRSAETHPVITGTADIARHGKQPRAAIVRLPEVQKGFAAVLDDPGDRRERLGVVDGRRLAVKPIARGERRLEARLALLAFERFEQRGLFAADVGTVAVMVEELEVEARAEDAVAEVPRAPRLVDGFFHALVLGPDLAVNVVVPARAAHRVTRDDH